MQTHTLSNSTKWGRINQLWDGVSDKVRLMSRDPSPPDRRPYGVALQQEGYPLIKSWACGDWSVESQAEMKRFTEAIASQRSIPMLAVLAVATEGHPERLQELVESLPSANKPGRPSLRTRFWGLVKMGATSADYGVLITGLEKLKPESRKPVATGPGSC